LIKPANNCGTATLVLKTISEVAILTSEGTLTNSTGELTGATTQNEESFAETVGDQTTTVKPLNTTAPGLSASATEVSLCDLVNTLMTGPNPDIESGRSVGPLKNALITSGTTSKSFNTTAQVKTVRPESRLLTSKATLKVSTTPATLTEPLLVQVPTTLLKTRTDENHSTIGSLASTKTVAPVLLSEV